MWTYFESKTETETETETGIETGTQTETGTKALSEVNFETGAVDVSETGGAQTETMTE